MNGKCRHHATSSTGVHAGLLRRPTVKNSRRSLRRLGLALPSARSPFWLARWRRANLILSDKGCLGMSFMLGAVSPRYPCPRSTLLLLWSRRPGPISTAATVAFALTLSALTLITGRPASVIFWLSTATCRIRLAVLATDFRGIRQSALLFLSHYGGCPDCQICSSGCSVTL